VVKYCQLQVKLLLHISGLYFWYKWLDGKFPSTAGKVIAKKITLDAIVVGLPFYSVFYVGKILFFYFIGKSCLNVKERKILYKLLDITLFYNAN